jgi:hypothetical protein
MAHDLGDLCIPTQALTDLIERRDEYAQFRQKRELLERMIRDLQTEMASRNKDC